MLAALLLLGLLPLAAMPLASGQEGDDSSADDEAADESNASPPSGEGSSQQGGNITDLLDDPADGAGTSGDAEQTEEDTVASDPDGEGDPDATDVFEFDMTPGVTTLQDFDAGVDLVQVDLSSLSDPVAVEFNQTDDGASLSFLADPEEPATLVFEDLGEVPADDVMIRLLDPVSGDSYEMSLNDAIGANEVYSVLDPEDPETPDDPPTEPVTDTPLEPVSPDAEEIDAGGDLTLRYLIETETDNVAGRSETLAEADAAGVTDVELTEADDIADRTDTEDGNVALSMGEAAPVLSSDAALDVVSGGAGDDQITLGDAGGFAFGGEGDDTLEARETVAALYGGEGNDALSLGSAEGYLDGGHGHDSLVGSAGDDVLEGGEHDASEGLGDDTLHGEAGDDLIRGGYGADSLDGGAGNDVIDHQGRTEERQDITQREHAWHTGEDADSLAGGEGDDTLIFDRHDVAEGGDGNDLFWLYHDGVDAGNIAEITDFEVGEDFLRISLNPQIGENDEPDVLVQPSQDGLDGHVIVNGDLVAVLKGAPSATPSDILATVEPDLFP